MSPPVSSWLRPTTIEAAAAAVSAGGIAFGGGALLLSAAFDTASGPYVDLAGVVPRSCGGQRAGAMATVAEVATFASGRWPAIEGACRDTANPNVRRVATLGGTVSARLPSCDLAAALAAHRAEVISVGPAGDVEQLPFVDFWTDSRRDRIVREIDLGAPAPGEYRRVSGRPGPGPALAAVAGVLGPDGLRLWAGAVAMQPIDLGSGLPEEADLLTDHRCSSGHRVRLIRALVQEVKARLSDSWQQKNGYR